MKLTGINLSVLKPPKGSGLEQISRMLERAYTQYRSSNNMTRSSNNTTNMRDPFESLKGSIQSISKSLSNAIGQLTKKPEVVDYTNIVKSFVPDNAKLLNPLYPNGAGPVLKADLDGDGTDELAATYRTNEGTKTLVLKSVGGAWQRAGEIYHQPHENIHYRNAVNLAGGKNKQLLIGMNGAGAGNTLYGYSLSGGAVSRLFSRDYDWIEFVRKPKNALRDGKETLSVWNLGDDGHYDIEALDWTGLDLERAENDAYYYRTRVAPYYLRKARQNPSDSNAWYRLAEAFVKGGAYREARMLTEAGFREEKDPQMKEKFLALRNTIITP